MRTDLVHKDNVAGLQGVEVRDGIIVVQVDAAVRQPVHTTSVESNTSVGEVHRVWHRCIVELAANFVLDLAGHLCGYRGGSPNLEHR